MASASRVLIKSRACSWQRSTEVGSRGFSIREKCVARIGQSQDLKHGTQSRGSLSTELTEHQGWKGVKMRISAVPVAWVGGMGQARSSAFIHRVSPIPSPSSVSPVLFVLSLRQEFI